LPNDGVFINPMRTTFFPPSPSDSGDSFFLHDPQEVIYNRVKDIFESDASLRDEPMVPINRNNELVVQAEIHSSSSGAASGSEDDDEDEEEEEESVEAIQLKKIDMLKPNSVAAVESHVAANSNNHDYEDIYLVREEAKINSKKNYGSRSRSRDSGSHSRSNSAGSCKSHEVILQTIVSLFLFLLESFIVHYVKLIAGK